MAAHPRATTAAADDRVWLARAVSVLWRPREVFAGLRDDSDDTARARSEAVLALVLLTGIAGVLWTPVAGTILNDATLDWLDVAVWAFLGGGFYAIALYFVGGLVLQWLSRAAGWIGYRQARHLLAFASAPVALSLFLVVPVRLAVYGEDVFRSGGSDRGAGEWAFAGVELAFAAWALVLLALGLRMLLSKSSSSSAGIS
jgi:Yip1 domain